MRLKVKYLSTFHGVWIPPGNYLVTWLPDRWIITGLSSPFGAKVFLR